MKLRLDFGNQTVFVSSEGFTDLLEISFPSINPPLFVSKETGPILPNFTMKKQVPSQIASAAFAEALEAAAAPASSTSQTAVAGTVAA